MSVKTVIVIGETGTLKACQIASLKAQGHKVIEFDADVKAVDLNACRDLIEGELRVIFTPYMHDEMALLDADTSALIAMVGKKTKAFLTQAQAALQLLMGRGGGQFWVADFDDSFAYHLETPCAPICAQARAGAVRSLAKEYSRMKISVNSMLVQPVSDPSTASMFRKASAELKSYAMRYKPNDAGAVADMLTDFVGTGKLQFSGNIIGTGTGIVQGHLTS
ncbi:hypothetical protein OS190_13270 [Sulfitobacter sp. F26204]|uniref:hypothetical protein n=1 Tax=Sulfitobacter sp. F26204 TaxID=2996014 RepID=UPI00225E5C85|nr:hypothetical protein [Sulfitobacter sp. F26204]MCX7560541.1 hypothetical protein [Sulfitobacter sp. F26204]